MTLTKNLLRDEALVDSIIRSCESGSCIPESLTQELNADDVRRFLQFSREQGLNTARANFPKDKADFVEAIILSSGRPAILIQNNTFASSSDEWGTRLEAARANLEKVIPAVGRIEMSNHPGGSVYKGCGWLVATDIIVTNSHVAKEFSIKDDGTGKFTFRKNVASFKTITARVDFREEYQIDKEAQFEVLEILYFDEKENPDIAFLRVSTNTIDRGVTVSLKTQPIPLSSTTITGGEQVAVIGYPSYDSERNPLQPKEMDKIFGDIYDVKRLQPGEILSARSDMLTHDCSTLGGNSGSVLVRLDTGEAIGLHYGGEFMKENWAISSQTIQGVLSRLGLSV